jgi:hypothetical protein
VLSERIDQVAATMLEHSARLASDGRCVALATYRMLAAGRRRAVGQISA